MTQTSLFDLPASPSKEEWLEIAREVAERIAIERGSVTADDIWDACPPPKSINPKTMAGVFKGFRYLSHVKSRRSECHHRSICRFALPTPIIEIKP
jgi:hypothetical protein